MPGTPPAQLHAIHLVLRKLAHLAEYAVLALLWFKAVHRVGGRTPRTAAWAAFSICLACAFADEAHQSTIPSRTPSPPASVFGAHRLRPRGKAEAAGDPPARGGPRQSARRGGCRARRLPEPRPVLLYDQARRLDQARRPAMRPVRNTPSNVPAPPIDTAGAPIRATRGGVSRTGPLNAPIEHAT